MDKNLMWAVTTLLLVAMVCGTVLWINHNSWTVRFEMDNNTKEAIKSIDFENIQPKKCEQIGNYTYACPEGYVEMLLPIQEVNTDLITFYKFNTSKKDANVLEDES